MTNEQAAGRKRSSRWRRRLAIGAAVSALATLCLPTLIAHTPLRNLVINALLSDRPWRAEAGGASFGWFSPVSLSGLELKRKDGESRIEIAALQADRSWLEMLWDRADLGRLVVDHPDFRCVLSGEAATPTPSRPARGGPTLALAVNGGSFSLRQQAAAAPVVELRNVGLQLRIERDAAGRFLAIPPSRILDRQRLTPDLCDRGLHLIAPVLANAARVEGQVTLELDGLRMPLDRASLREELVAARAHGRLIVHQVATGLKNPLLQSIAELAARLLNTSMPETVKLVEEREIAFHIEKGRVFHEGLAFGLPELDPDLVFRTRGSVGMDETLDLTVEAPAPADVLGDEPLARALSERPLVIAVTGTLSAPKIQLAQNGGAIEKLLRAILEGGGKQETPLAGTILDAIGELTDSASGPTGDGEPLRDLLRQWRERREKRREGDSSRPPASEGAEKTPRRPLRRLLDRIRSRQEPPPSPTP